MDKLADKVAHLCFTLKKHTIAPYFQYMSTNNGHILSRRVGPLISAFFYLTQALHAIVFAFVV